MSRRGQGQGPYGGFRGRGRGRGGGGRPAFRPHDLDDEEGPNVSFPRPPLHFRGKELGRFYAAQQRQRHKERKEGGSEDRDQGRERREDSGVLRRPPNLKGREIGMWYAMQGKRNRTLNLPRITLSSSRQGQIANLLDQLDAFTSSKSATDADSNKFMERYQSNLLANALATTTSEDVKPNLGSLLVADSQLDAKLQREHDAKQSSTSYQNMMKFRTKLPAFQQKDEFLKLIRDHQVVVISGETGCGKTTQCCQLILDDMIASGNGSKCNIICTQPRRISAISVAERVAEERDEKVGNSVGYSIRLESRLPSRDRGSILFCTTGVVFQYLKNDPSLSKYSFVVVDEIHERDVLSDFLIVILKDLIRIRTDLKVILMSATINANQFSTYFNNCPMFTIPGFTFPVQEYYLEDVLQKTRFTFEQRFEQNQHRQPYRGGRGSHGKPEDGEYTHMFETHLRKLHRESAYPRYVLSELEKPQAEELNLELVESLLVHICETDKNNGAVLIFVPGWDQISKLNNLLQTKFPPARFLIIPLHSMMPTVNQKQVFSRPPEGRRKIVIATNIAETSITIDDIVFVINTGKIKMTNFDLNRNLETLDTEWVSLANATQRKGRAGRVQEGVCYHLYNKARQMVLERFKKPEVLRKRLEEVVLQIKMLKLGAAGRFLRRLMDPPSETSVDLAVKRLVQLNALDDDENLTPLGFHLAHLPMDPQTGKMVLMSAIFGCVDPVLSVAASLSFKDPFYIPLGQERNVDNIRKDFSQGTKSDHLVTTYAIQGYQDACADGKEGAYCYRNFLSGNTVRLLINMKGQFAQYLAELKFIETDDSKDVASNVHSENVSVVKAIICAGLYPNVARVIIKKKPDGRCTFPKISTIEDGKVDLHPKSVNSDQREYESPFLVYFQKMKSKSLFLFDTSMVSPFPLIFFGGRLTFRLDKKVGIVSVDHVAEFLIEKPIFEIILALRKHLDKLLEEKIVNPGPTCWNSLSREGALLRAIIELITTEYKELSGEGHSDSDSDSED